MESSNGHDYVVVFSAAKSQRASFAVTAFSREHAYAFTLGDVAIERPTALPFEPYRSAPTLFENPDPAPLLAYSIDVTPGSPATNCAVERDRIASPADVVRPAYHRTAQEAVVLRDIVTETNALATVVTPELRPDVIVPHCAEPFADAQTVNIATPVYPLIASDHSVAGNTRVKVTLDDTGAVTDAIVYTGSGSPALDEAAVKAARATTYSPDVFLCRPSGGNYLFQADFRTTPH